MANLYIIAGCNGAGKTTASYTVLPEMLNCKEFINADEIAKGISPFQPEKVAIESGRIMLKRIKNSIINQVDFAFETTLSTKTYVQFVQNAQIKGYFVTLVYFWLNTPELAIERVKSRVLSGGHDIPEKIIHRRYLAGIKNLSNLYLPICDYWLLIDNSVHPFQIIAEGFKQKDIKIYNRNSYKQIIQK